MTADLELYNPPELEAGRRRWVELMRPAAELAAQIAGTEFVPKGMRDNPAAIAACVLYGDEVGLGPMQALAKIAVIDGRPSLAAEAMRSLIFSAGHELWVEEASTQKAVVAGRRAESKNVTRVTWTQEDAKRANLAAKPNWRFYPRQMLLARATAELARLIFADAIGGLSATEELAEEIEAGMEPEEAEPTRPRGRARRRQSTPLAPVPEPEAPAAADAETEKLSEPQRRKLHALFRERGADRAERLKWASEVLGREVPSFTDLSRLEGSTLIETLQADEIPFGLPEPTGGPPPAAPPAEGLEPPETTEDTPAAPSEPTDTPSGEPPTEPLSVVMFRARFVHEGFTVEDVAEAGRDLYPGRSLGDLEDSERGALLEHLIAERGPLEDGGTE